MGIFATSIRGDFYQASDTSLVAAALSTQLAIQGSRSEAIHSIGTKMRNATLTLLARFAALRLLFPR
jgi:hypothetical protein